jgi:hypothetical protein
LSPAVAGVVLYENIIRRPFGEMAAYIRYAQCSGTFLIWSALEFALRVS